jgi:hypothetical protein
MDASAHRRIDVVGQHRRDSVDPSRPCLIEPPDRPILRSETRLLGAE